MNYNVHVQEVESQPNRLRRLRPEREGLSKRPPGQKLAEITCDAADGRVAHEIVSWERLAVVSRGWDGMMSPGLNRVTHDANKYHLGPPRRTGAPRVAEGAIWYNVAGARTQHVHGTL